MVSYFFKKEVKVRLVPGTKSGVGVYFFHIVTWKLVLGTNFLKLWQENIPYGTVWKSSDYRKYILEASPIFQTIQGGS